MSHDPVLEAWAALATTAAIGCAALLAGVLVVTAIRAHGSEPAATAVLALVTALLASLAVLVPGQAPVALGLELSVLGLVLGVVSIVRVGTAVGRARWRLLLPMLPVAGLVVGGVVVETDDANGLYWVFGGVALAVVIAVECVWSLLTAPSDV